VSATILVVDDSATIRQQVSIALKQAGFTTVEAADGHEGLAQIDANREIALVVCDVNMPNMDGLEMVAIVKRKDEHKALPILMLTTEGQPSLIRRAKDAGAVGWIVKPFDANQLVMTAKHLTTRKP
jgi:two-component system chemotaxis response regulator CheY